MAETKRIGVIGGSGLYEIEGLTNISEVRVDTPFGVPSDAFVKGTIGDVELYFLPRHAKGHKIMPSELNSRANIYAFKKLGVKALISISAVGSMKEEIEPGDFVIVDQFIDRTKATRVNSFFGNGIVAHVPLADPVCPVLNQMLYQVRDPDHHMHSKGTYICIDGPQFSTRAESNFYRMLGVDVIGMTACPEYKLAREAGLHFAVVALSTDYDCWNEDEEDVTVEAIINTIKSNVAGAKSLIRRFAEYAGVNWAKLEDCGCENALKNTVMTNPETFPKDTYKKLELLLGKYYGSK
ncbi:MAG: S-methyl-5'-thioadenosine phosphorylase [Oligoflexia bacterium]|nr:S-methyl-5'-thioadenosine phosphorylase [Oligoflexia bacterium]